MLNPVLCRTLHPVLSLRAFRRLRWIRRLPAVRRLRAWTAANQTVRRLRRDRPAPELIFPAIRELAAAGRTRQARALIRLAGRTGADPVDLRRLHRLLAGYSGTISAPVLRRAAAAAGPGRRGRTPVPVTGLAGRGADVEAVVRYRLPGGGTMIRKTLVGDRPREVSSYRSGLWSGGRTWRVPRLHHAEREAVPGAVPRWHLFLEDLGSIERLEEPELILTAARALGEFGGARLGDPVLGSLPWLTDRAEPYRRLEELRDLGRTVRGTVAPEIADRLEQTLDRLAARRIELRERFLALPSTLCHGDPTRSNVTVRGDVLIMFDLGSCHRGPVGSDLGVLLAVPNPSIRHRRLSLADCLEQYRCGVEAAAGPVDPDQLGFGFRYRLLIKSLAWQLVRLPPPVTTAATGGRARRIMIKRRSVEADLGWLCDEAELLLGAATVAPDR
ncbi:phosphotransferase [Microlunatus parietis]|uniref:Aminoglycoside phosphotransferase domain-containing protein n=1 Tax=Microlunatus parietis TaxID=682979 RepID=A0A7Y9IDM9_9ACTN|nr:phosphotransferase [Microlunatus parietis]NYE75026.1 hypothetical protein [Microlunatus parietis]